MGKITVLTLGLALLFLSLGCKEKVDCKKMQSRLVTCMHDNYRALNKKGRNLKDPRFKRDANELSAKYIKVIDKYYYDVCKGMGGKDSRAKKINKCLAQKTCTDVHACLKHVLK